MKPGARKNTILAIEIAALLDMWRSTPAKQHLVVRRKEAVRAEKRNVKCYSSLEELGL